MTLSPLASDAPVIVYIDFKSPYAYLAIEPTRELERQLGVQFDWRPFVLDIPSYLGSARLGKAGEVVEQQRSEEQWSGVKYAYYDCRRYANLWGLKIRGTEKIWDTNLVSTAMLWTRLISHAATQQFIDSVYPRFWVRDLDIESEEVVAGLLSAGGLDGQAFLEWAHNGGSAINADFQSAAFEAGVYGVPTFVVDGERYFGREHLPRVRWHIEGGRGDAPDIANPLPAELLPHASLPEHVYVGVDSSLDSLRAIPELAALLKNYSGAVSWVRVTSKEPSVSKADGDDNADGLTSRSAMHRQFRKDNAAASRERYGVLGVAEDSYPEAIEALLNSLNIKLSPDVPEKLLRPAMPGVNVLLDDEIFIGRQHLPLLAKKLGLGG
ncbi:DsbA family protein [Congregibacter brevis]|uniref:DsbA family protein n=1 Tax=Congregibacter brevis TaxID=3081201 RepID=A0ABZ0IGB5_9GAMM|nr:DsbA family protein [Congregibacter sp. IMCC45268]